MLKKNEESYIENGFLFNYECDRCKIDVGIGTGFCFDQGGNDCHLCMPCYEIFWREWKKIEKEYVERFLKKESIEPQCETMPPSN